MNRHLLPIFATLDVMAGLLTGRRPRLIFLVLAKPAAARMSVLDKLSETHQGIKRIRSIRKQINGVNERMKGHSAEDEIKKAGKEILDGLKTIEEALYQTKNKEWAGSVEFPHSPQRQAFRCWQRCVGGR